MKTDNEDLVEHECRDCGKKVLTIDVEPPKHNESRLLETGVWVDPFGKGDDWKTFVLCDDCADKLYQSGKLGYTLDGAFLV